MNKCVPCVEVDASVVAASFFLLLLITFMITTTMPPSAAALRVSLLHPPHYRAFRLLTALLPFLFVCRFVLCLW